MAASVQSMHDYWRTFDLQNLQKELDSTATELAGRQEDSDCSRKALVESSRDFKKNTPEDIRKVVAPLLKKFQTEVDSLSKRSKAAEAAFLSIYKRLIDIPDPVDTLEHCLTIQKRAHKVQDLEIENRQLRDTLNEYNNEFAEVKNQEVTIKQLKEKLKEHEENLEITVQSKTKEKERELQRDFAEKERQLQETQLTVARKLGEAEHRIATLESALEGTQSEMFDVKAKYDESTSAKSDETDLLMADVEKANERAVAAEREVERLKQQLLSANQNLAQAEQMQQAPDMEQALDILKSSSLEVELQAKEKEISQLVEDVQKLQASLKQLRDHSSTQIAKLEEEVASKEKAFRLLEEKIKSQEDYEEIKRELRILKSIEFSNTDETDKKAKSLEALLLEKNKSLQAENTQLKVTSSDMTGRYGKLQEQYGEAFTTIQEQKNLIEQLEDDLRKINAVSSMFRPAAEGEDGPPSQSAELVADAVKEVTQTVSAKLESVSAADSILPIVQSQRERFRVRAQELEAQTISLQQQVQMLQNEADKLRSDNVKLYEKIKFLQMYPTKGIKHTDDIESRYSSQYEAGLDPFQTFSKKERMVKYMNLKPHEKITLSLGKFIMGNNIARTIFFFYILLLHLLVFLALYKVANTASCKRDLAASCHQQFADHMAKEHGNTHFSINN